MKRWLYSAMVWLLLAGSAFALTAVSIEQDQTITGQKTLERAILDDPHQLTDNVVAISKYADFPTAISTIGSSTQTTLLIDRLTTVASNTTVTSNITLWFIGSGQLSINSGVTVTINGPLIAPPRQIFSGSGVALFTSNQGVPSLLPQWWGAVVNDSSESVRIANVTAIQAAFDGVPTNGATVLFPAGDYYVPATTQPLNTGMFRITKSRTTVLAYGAKLITPTAFGGTPLLQIGVTAGAPPANEAAFTRDIYIYGLAIDMNQTAIDAVNFNQAVSVGYTINAHLVDMRIENAGFTGIGVTLGGQGIWVEDNFIVDTFGDGIHVGDEVAPFTIRDVWIKNNVVKTARDNAIGMTAGSTRIYVLGNTLDTPSTDGVAVAGASDVEIIGNKIVGLGRHGISAIRDGGFDSFNLLIAENRIGPPATNQYGIQLGSGNNLTATSHQIVRGNIIDVGTASGAGGIFVQGTHDARIEDNLIFGTGTLDGITMFGTAGAVNARVVISRNTFKSLNRGIVTSDPAQESAHEFYDNRYDSVTTIATNITNTYPTLWETDKASELAFFKNTPFTLAAVNTGREDKPEGRVRLVSPTARVTLHVHADEGSNGTFRAELFNVTTSAVLDTLVISGGAAWYGSAAAVLIAADAELTVRFFRTSGAQNYTVNSALIRVY